METKDYLGNISSACTALGGVLLAVGVCKDDKKVKNVGMAVLLVGSGVSAVQTGCNIADMHLLYRLTRYPEEYCCY